MVDWDGSEGGSLRRGDCVGHGGWGGGGGESSGSCGRYSLHPSMFAVYSTNRKDAKCLTSLLISIQTLSVLINLPFFLLILSFRKTDRAAITGPTDPHLCEAQEEPPWVTGP
jgi:hypothetical protein